MDGIELAKGVVAGFTIDLIRDRTRMMMIIGLVLVAIGVVGMLVFDGFGAAALGVAAFVGLLIAGIGWLARRLATRAVRLFADPAPDPQMRVRAALDEADLPTGPFSVARLLVRLARGGAGEEIDRLGDVLSRLADDAAQT